MKTKIKEYREELKLSQHELAEKANVAYTIINQLENETRNVVTSDTMLKISKALGKPVRDVFML